MQQPMQLERAGQWSTVPAVYTTTEIAQASGDPISFRDVTAPVWRRKGVVAGIAILGAVGGLLASLYMTPVYRARVSMQVVGFNDEHFLHELTPESPSLANASAENYLQNQVKMLESDSLAKRVADKLPTGTPAKPGMLSSLIAGIRNHVPFLKPWPTTPEERRINKVKASLSVRTSLQSQVVEVFYDDRDPKIAAAGANSVASEFMDLNREARQSLVQDTTEWLDRQAADLKSRMDKANAELQGYARSSGLVFAGTQSTLEEDRMRLIQDSLERARADRAAKESRYNAAMAISSAPLSDTMANSPLHQYEIDLQNEQKELAQLKTTYTPTNYKVQRLEAQIAETQKAIEGARSEILGGLKTEYTAAAGLEKMLAEAHARQMGTVEQQMEKERKYTTMKADADAMQRLYDATLEKVKEAGAASALRSTSVRVIDNAGVPSAPYSPNIPMNVAVGLSVGLIGGVWLVLLREGSGKVRKPGQATIMQVPELGVIPAAQDARALDLFGRGLRKFKYRAGELRLITREHDASVLKESFRAVLTSILFSAGIPRNGEARAGGRVVVVTSVDVKEGKTTVLTNLGISAAERKLRVLVIDADLRRPRLHDLLDTPNDWGLANLLQEQGRQFFETAPLEAMARQTRTPNLWVLPSGPAIDAINSLLYSADVEALLARFRKEFDLVLIDTPPMMLYSDGRVLGRISDGVVMVVRANTKSRDELKSTYLRFMLDQIPILGTVLNDWRMDPQETRAYGRYHEHYQQGK